MCKRTTAGLRRLPTLIVSAGLIVGAAMKITAVHPMMPHFSKMGLRPYLTALGFIELVCISLFLFRRTVKLGLLLLTAYLGGAMAAEMPYQMMAAPATALFLVWAAAFSWMPELFMVSKNPLFTTAKS